MESAHSLKRDNPAESANLFSKLFFIWMRTVIHEANTEELSLQNLYKIEEKDKSTYLAMILTKTWDIEMKNAKLRNRDPSLLRAIAKAFFLEYSIWGFVFFISTGVLKTLQPLVLSNLIKLIGTAKYDSSEIVINGIVLCSICCLSAFLDHHSMHALFSIGMRIRVAVSSLIYRKILKLSPHLETKVTTGQIVNLLSNDASKFAYHLDVLHWLWIAPIQVTILTYSIWKQIGISTSIGISFFVIILLPQQLIIAKLLSKYQEKKSKNTDHRITMMSYISSGIQVIKMYVWEKPFELIIEGARNKEIKYLRKTAHARGIITSYMIFTLRSTFAATLICFSLTGHEIKAEIVFPVTMLFSLMMSTLSGTLSSIMYYGAETFISIKRLEAILILKEKETLTVDPSANNNICLRHVQASWESNIPTLKDLNMNIAPGSFFAIIGPVASGKSSLLKLLIGELISSSGTIHIPGTISYAAQESWLFGASIKKNILFGNEFDKYRYQNIIKICALEKDLQQFPKGDETNVADRGVSLSGGQRARINLARAIYRKADIYLIDDPLSAVDTTVGKHLFDHCFVKYLKGKTRILITQHLQYVQKADWIIVLNKGSIVAEGTFDQILEKNLEFTNSMITSEETTGKEHSEVLKLFSTPTKTKILQDEKGKENMENQEDKCNYKGCAYWDYAKNGGNFPLLCIMASVFLLCQLVVSGADFWVSIWTHMEDLVSHSTPILNTSTELKLIHMNNSESYYHYDFVEHKGQSSSTAQTTSFLQSFWNKYTQRVIVNGNEFTILTNEMIIYIYVSFVISLIVLAVTKSILFHNFCVSASKHLHNNMFKCLLQAPMRFFDTNCNGKLLNRFAKDMGAIDEHMPVALLAMIEVSLITCGALILILITNPYLIITVTISCVLLYKVVTRYVTTTRFLRLLECAGM
ncbi:hypothetical protein HHI36_006592 [Cryptolaemus montrouzieri]|uniref:Multidrug resistance-associated protein 4 n=1 Tax=Cryptolaemus montrouzieri TaxID=559131 RepID=A0ABD2NXL7_9CUCU